MRLKPVFGASLQQSVSVKTAQRWLLPLLRARLAADSLKTGRCQQRWLTDASSNKQQQQQPPIRLTDECVRRLAELHRSQGSNLRVTVEGGGCSGFQYKFLLDDGKATDSTTAADFSIECPDGSGAKVLIDSESLELLRGCTLDYQRELIREGFKVVANPQAEKGCSCGSSFAVRMD